MKVDRRLRVGFCVTGRRGLEQGSSASQDQDQWDQTGNCCRKAGEQAGFCLVLSGAGPGPGSGFNRLDVHITPGTFWHSQNGVW